MQNNRALSDAVARTMLAAVLAGGTLALAGCPKQPDKAGSPQATSAPTGDTAADAAAKTAAAEQAARKAADAAETATSGIMTRPDGSVPLRPPSMPAGKAALPDEWPAKEVKLPADALPGLIPADARARATDAQVSADGSTGHVVASESGVAMDIWRIAFISGEEPAKYVKQLELQLKPAAWRGANNDVAGVHAYYAKDGASTLALSFRENKASSMGKYDYELQLMHYDPPRMGELYKWARVLK